MTQNLSLRPPGSAHLFRKLSPSYEKPHKPSRSHWTTKPQQSRHCDNKPGCRDSPVAFGRRDSGDNPMRYARQQQVLDVGQCRTASAGRLQQHRRLRNRERGDPVGHRGGGQSSLQRPQVNTATMRATRTAPPVAGREAGPAASRAVRGGDSRCPSGGVRARIC